MRGAMLLACLAACAACQADRPRTETDKETGVVLHYVTSQPCMNTIGYPTCHTWSRDGEHLFIESGRPRPDGTRPPIERQLLKLNIETGEAVHLASLEVEDTQSYGQAHMRTSTQYHADYAPEADVLVYYDMTGHNMYLMDAATGRRERILHESEGTIGDPPAITPDGKRVVYHVFFPSIANRFMSAVTSVIFSLDVDPKTLKAVSEPKIITVYPGRTVQGPAAEKFTKGIQVNHSQVNPTNPDHYCYAHEFGGMNTDGSLVLTRTWDNLDGIDRPVCRLKPGEWHTHEVIGPKGKALYFVENWGVASVDFETREKRTVYKPPTETGPRAWHITVSPDEKWIAADMVADGDADADGNYHSGIVLIENATGKSKVLCHIPRGKSHPRHPHPNFSPDGKRIAFVVPDGKENSQVAYVDIADVIARW